MNRDLMGEQIHAHLRLYKDLGVRYLESKERVMKARTVAPRQPTTARSAPTASSELHKTEPANPVTPKETKTLCADAAGGIGNEALDAILAEMGNCQKCKLAATRTNLVFGSGNPHADLMFVGEAPGADEDAQGLPFVGRAGRLLTLIIEAIGIRREDVFICNILKCRPPGNRNPEADEIAACEGFLFRQIEAIQPRAIVALGAFGAQTLLKTTDAIGKLRGRLTDYRGVKMMATYHPAYLLRNPLEKRKVWEDMRLVRDYLRSL